MWLIICVDFVVGGVYRNIRAGRPLRVTNIWRITDWEKNGTAMMSNGVLLNDDHLGTNERIMIDHTEFEGEEDSYFLTEFLLDGTQHGSNSMFYAIDFDPTLDHENGKKAFKTSVLMFFSLTLITLARRAKERMYAPGGIGFVAAEESVDRAAKSQHIE